MERNMRLLSLIVGFTFVLSGVSAQVGLAAGMSTLIGFGSTDRTSPWGGFHIAVEVPRDDEISMYGRFTHHFNSQSSNPITPDGIFTGDFYFVELVPRDLNSGLPNKYIGATPKMNYNILEGGTRYYLGSGFDFGWSAYGGGNFMLMFNSVKLDYDTYDESLYAINDAIRLEGTIVSLGFGLGGGVKYSTAPMGTFYFDVNLNYLIYGQASNPGVYADMYSPLLFNFNLGFRKDILW